ncbi:MAG: LLM class flavin-dependent oxidoreductase [Nitriliruptoraceae bacterium]
MTSVQTERPQHAAVGLAISEDLPIRQHRLIARTVEELGLASLWTNEAQGRDALHLCHAWATETTTLQLGIGVLPLWTRSPAQLAMAAATVQDASHNRLLLGVGVSHPATMGPWHGAAYRKPVTACREALEILEQVFSGERTDYVGDVYRCERFVLQMTPLPQRPPTYLAAMGPKMLALAGTHADGVLLNWSDPNEVARASTTIREAAEREGRDPHQIDIAAYVRVCVADKRDDAVAALARELSAYGRLEAYAAHFSRQGHGPALERAAEAKRAGADGYGLAEALGEETLAAFGWVGTPGDDPAPAVARWSEAGLTRFLARVISVGDPASNIQQAARLFAAV